MPHLRIFGHYIHTPYLMMAAAEAVLMGVVAYLGHFLRYQALPGVWEHFIPAGSFALIVIVSMMAIGVYESRLR